MYVISLPAPAFGSIPSGRKWDCRVVKRRVVRYNLSIFVVFGDVERRLHTPAEIVLLPLKTKKRPFWLENLDLYPLYFPR